MIISRGHWTGGQVVHGKGWTQTRGVHSPGAHVRWFMVGPVWGSGGLWSKAIRAGSSGHYCLVIFMGGCLVF